MSGDPPGDVPGPGLISLNTGYNIPVGKKETKERCAEICNHNSRCRSFLYSKKVGRCKITAELQPSKPLEPQFRHWVMCSKSGSLKAFYIFWNHISIISIDIEIALLYKYCSI